MAIQQRHIGHMAWWKQIDLQAADTHVMQNMQVEGDQVGVGSRQWYLQGTDVIGHPNLLQLCSQ